MPARYRSSLPQLQGDLFLSDGGMETTLIFHRGNDLPEFAAFPLLDDPEGSEEIRRYYRPYLRAASGFGAGFILESPTWRASRAWGDRLGRDAVELERLNRKAIGLMEEIRAEAGQNPETQVSPIVISGCIGPHDDGYSPAEVLSAEAAADYHSQQIDTFADTAADMVTALTMTYLDEAVGIARAATAVGMPVAISFTVETDGRLPSGQDLGEAIEAADADSEIAYFMLNCAHPSHFDSVLADAGPWRERIRGLRANASKMSHAELDEATELDAGDPGDLGARYAGLRGQLPRLNVLGGCCGTDDRHVEEIGRAWTAGAAG
ncbi:MAG: homocysteine S-methyltransferase family protein [Thermoleophilia bacterium]|nr:homocysteine S-methyltransferase family protein [Thermoleophilia bacterium]